MRRVLARWGRVTIYSYQAMLYTGIVLGIAVQARAARAASLDESRTIIVTLLLLIPALLGSRLLYIAENWQQYRFEPHRIWRTEEGGAAMYGGLLLALPMSVPLAAAARLPFRPFWDTASFTMLVGMIVTRIGCLLNGCCSGRPTTGWFGLNLPDHRGLWQRRIPTQLLEAGLGAVLLAATLLLFHLRLFPGATFLFTVAGYAAGRVLLEPLREDQDRILGLLSGVLAATAVAVFVTLWSYR